MGPFKGLPDILVNAIPSGFAFDLQFVCFSFVYHSFRFYSLLKNFFFLAKDDGH